MCNLGKPAEVLAKYTQKGSLIAVNGELQSRSYDDQQGQTHYVTELVVAGFEFLESKETVQNREQNNKCQKWRTPNRFMVWMIWNRLLIIKIYLKGENEKLIGKVAAYSSSHFLLSGCASLEQKHRIV